MIKMIAIRVVFNSQMIKTKGKRVGGDDLPSEGGTFFGGIWKKKTRFLYF